MSHPYIRRLLKEYKTLTSADLAGISVYPHSEPLHYYFEITVDNALYQNEVFLLTVKIGPRYPVDSPLVQFVLDSTHVIPVHPHVYGNGHICLNILGKDWTPACSVELIVLSVQSMLSTNTIRTVPPDNDQYVSLAPLDPKKSRFVYHDDDV